MNIGKGGNSSTIILIAWIAAMGQELGRGSDRSRGRRGTSSRDRGDGPGVGGGDPIAIAVEVVEGVPAVAAELGKSGGGEEGDAL